MVQLQISAERRLGRVRGSSNETKVEMHIRQLTVASVLSLAAISFPGSTQAAKAATPLALCNADAERICPGVAPGGGKIIACLKQHKDEVRSGSAKASKAVRTKKRMWSLIDPPPAPKLRIANEDGSHRSNRRVPPELLGGVEQDKPARGFTIAQDREIAEKSGRAPLAIKSITSAGATTK